MRFRSYLLESKELAVLSYFPLSSVETERARRLIAALNVVGPYLKKLDSLAAVRELHSALLDVHCKEQVIIQLIDECQRTIDAFEKAEVVRELVKTPEYRASSSAAGRALKDAFLNGDKEAMRKHSAILKDKHARHIIATTVELAMSVKRGFQAEPSIFGSNRLISSFGSADYETFAKLDLGVQLYTSVPMPKVNAEVDEFVFFLRQLRDSPAPVRMNDEHDFRVHIKVALKNEPKFQELLRLTDEYLHSNNKKLIPQIVDLVSAIPLIKSANDKARRKHKVVYRGIGLSDDMSEEEIIDKELEQKYVATSTSFYAAKNFALQKGHLESSEMRRAEYSYVLEYHVSPDAIVLDTKVIDTVYNESEVLIDVTKVDTTKIIFKEV